MNIVKPVKDRLRCSNLIKHGFTAARNLFLKMTPHDESRASRIRHTVAFEALEIRDVFANASFLYLEMATHTEMERPIDYPSQQGVHLAKPVQRTSAVEVRIFGIEFTMERTPRTPNPSISTFETQKARFDASGLVGEGESAPFQPNVPPGVTLASQFQLNAPPLETGKSLSKGNTSQRTNESPNGTAHSQVSVNSTLGSSERTDPSYASVFQMEMRSTSLADTIQLSLDSDVKKSRLAISNTDLYLNTPFETRASEALLFNSSPSMINRDTTASNVDAALAGDLDFFERDLIGRLLGEAKRTQESTGIVSWHGNSIGDFEPLGTLNIDPSTSENWLALPAGMVYLPLEIRTPANFADGKSIPISKPPESSELGLIQWFSTYDDQDLIPNAWEAIQEISGVEESNTSQSGSNSDLMFIILISGVLGSSRGFLIAKKERYIHNLSQSKNGGNMRANFRISRGRN